MKNSIIKICTALAIGGSLASCGDKFLDTKIYDSIDVDNGLSSATAVGYALNGTYYRLYQYPFGGNYATMFADAGSDITYYDARLGAGWLSSIYYFSYTDTDTYLNYIWNYGYKIIDNAARVIKACDNLLPEATGDDEIYLKLYEAEARCLRAYASQVLVNIFSHQAKVNGQDYTNDLGIVVVDEPIEAFSEVSRSTIGQTYSQITNDLQTAISLFEEIGGDQGDLYYFSEGAAYGLLARANMYLENWSAAASAAKNALAISGVTVAAYTPAAYKALYNGGASNVESIFALAIDPMNNFSANSCGTLFSTYGWSVSPYLMSLYGENDCRRSIMSFVNDKTDWTTYFEGGKFGYYGGSEKSYATNYLINAPEMYLIQAEAYANMGQVADAQEALFVVAHRNPAIASESDLPSTTAGLLSFIKDERARELFQEGFRLWDLRRWGNNVNLTSYDAPNIKFQKNDVNVSNLVFPIPVDEINAGFGVTQNEGWSSTRPQ